MQLGTVVLRYCGNSAGMAAHAATVVLAPGDDFRLRTVRGGGLSKETRMVHPVAHGAPVQGPSPAEPQKDDEPVGRVWRDFEPSRVPDAEKC